jgi:hypothetical protein
MENELDLNDTLSEVRRRLVCVSDEDLCSRMPKDPTAAKDLGPYIEWVSEVEATYGINDATDDFKAQLLSM